MDCGAKLAVAPAGNPATASVTALGKVPFVAETVIVNCAAAPGFTVCVFGEEVIEKLGAAIPVPLNATVCGEVLALSATERDAVKLAAETGVKVTDIEQLVPGASVAPQVLVWPKSLGFAPVMEMPVIFSTEPPAFESEIFCAALVVPACVDGKLTEVGLKVTCGAAALIVNVMEFEVPPPGVGLVTVTPGVPTLATSPAEIAAVSCVALTNVVFFALPLKFTTELLTKFEPLTVNVNAAEPAEIVDG